MNRRSKFRVASRAAVAVPARPAKRTAAGWVPLLKNLRRLLLRPLFSGTRKRRELRLVQVEQLGEKRFVAVIRAGGRKYLIGGGNGSVTLLTELAPTRRCAELKREIQ